MPMFSLPLWTILIDGLLSRLSESEFDVQIHTDDRVNIIRDEHIEILMKLLLNTQNLTINLDIKLSKTLILSSIKRMKLNYFTPTIDGIAVTTSTEIEYLGRILYQKLTWNYNLNGVKENLKMVLCTSMDVSENTRQDMAVEKKEGLLDVSDC